MNIPQILTPTALARCLMGATKCPTVLILDYLIMRISEYLMIIICLSTGEGSLALDIWQRLGSFPINRRTQQVISISGIFMDRRVCAKNIHLCLYVLALEYALVYFRLFDI